MKKIKNKKVLFIIVGLILVFVIGISSCIILNPKEESKPEEIASLESYKECPYTLDEFYKKIENDELHKCNIFDKECQQLASVVFHFYEYFNKETKFIAAAKTDQALQPLEYKYVTYEEYMKEAETWNEHIDNLEKKGMHSTITARARYFIASFGKLE